MDRWRGCDWTTSAVLAADTLVPGFYRIDVDHRDDPSRSWCMCLLLRHIASQPVVVVAPTNTWNAYNDFGGLSNYRDQATPLPLRPIRALMRWFNVRLRIANRHWLFAVPLPERRPNSHIHHDLVDNPGAPAPDIRAEAALIRFLERESAPYMVISDRDFAYDISTSRIRVIIFNTHSEYWSEEMIARLGEVIDRGCSIIFLSGNNIYRKVQFMEMAISVIDMMIPQDEVVPLIGTYSDAYGWRTYDAYRVTDAGHWCFEGLNVVEGSEFGHGTTNRPGASGLETR
jgi:N,N-dimethylformamidase